ncbi:hypothetical protein KUTeg_021673 [Tegillarca granosa]|uniref:F5/8 type C domain-containing protein n=1 Tax=Tegillarca granosa TaxID=220873 RepID=A0ABQ9E401_TEGGR|nr:hypothetical protein KUTeg_021673 [Tegillarca granosa]
MIIWGFRGMEYAAFFLLEYQREDDGEWIRFRKRNGEEKFKGNSNTYLAEVRDVDPPIIGKRIRFIPYADHARTVCMRVELHGCKWPEIANKSNITTNGIMEKKKGLVVEREEQAKNNHD